MCWVIESQDVGLVEPISTLVEPNFDCFKRHVLTTLAGRKWTAPAGGSSGWTFLHAAGGGAFFFSDVFLYVWRIICV